MVLSKSEQIKFAKELLPLIEATSDPEMLDRFHRLAAIVLELSGFETNGIAFDLSEYSYEVAQGAIKGEKKVWADEAKKSLEEAIRQDN